MPAAESTDARLFAGSCTQTYGYTLIKLAIVLISLTTFMESTSGPRRTPYSPVTG
jgi:hypothetical protein